MVALPPGLSPITAGRLGLWLLGKRQQTAASRRVALPVSAYAVTPATLAHRLRALVAPWSVAQYPGGNAVLAALCGASVESVRQWFRMGRGIPAVHRERLALWLEDRAAVMVVMASELREGMDRNKNRYARRDTTMRQDAAGTIKILTNGEKPGPATFAQAEHSQAQVNAEIFNQPQPSPRAAKRPSVSKNLTPGRTGKAKRKARP